MHKNIQIVIPMSGFGERFRRAGYKIPKPLIEIDGKPIIAHVIDMFPGEKEFIFICNQEHLDCSEYKMQEIIKKFCPTGKVIGIASHQLGPIHAVQQIKQILDPERPVVVNYCDFTCYWNWAHFKKFVFESKCDGAVPAYKGFHPHSLGNTNYAYIKETNRRIEDIQEKQPYTDNRMNEYASSGTYYFTNAELMYQAFEATVDANLRVNGEFYVSMAYKFLLKMQQKVYVYPLQHFMQWGTPADVQEYQNWSAIFNKLMISYNNDRIHKGTTVLPLAGAGQRFVNEGYDKIKPLINVSGIPMVLQAHADLPQTENNLFVVRKDMKELEAIKTAIQSTNPNSIIVELDKLTEGQACTAFEGVKFLKKDVKSQNIQPITFGACDNGIIFCSKKFTQLLDNNDVDIIVWGVRGHPNAIRQPQMYGWIDEKNGLINKVSVKQPLENPKKDPIILGTFTFKKIEYFESSLNSLIKKDHRINQEFYLDSCINEALALGLKCHYFEVEHYMSWGTPDELKTFEYWQSCFDKWPSHPYCLEKDTHINTGAIDELKKKYKVYLPDIPCEFEHA